MAPRGRSAIVSEDIDRSYDSSPDPLALSTNENKARTGRKTPAKEPLKTSTPSKQNRRLNISEMDFSSPSKSMVMSTPRMGSASPWRIKVTVQAEPGSDDENAESPSVTRVTRTKTTTIPLRDPDAQSAAKRPRGRPRKSDMGGQAKSKRSGTPLKKAARSKSRDASVGAADADTDVPPKRRRGRPRKSIQPQVEDEETPVIEQHEVETNRTLDATPVPAAKLQPTGPAEYELPVIDTPPRTELGKKLRARKGTPHSKNVVTVSLSSDEESDNDSYVLTPTSGDEDSESKQAARDHVVHGSLQEDLHTPGQQSPTPSSDHEHDAHVPTDDQDIDVLSAHGLEDDEDDDVQDATNFAFDEGTTRMPDDTTVLDSENFSMISVESLHSNGALSSPSNAEVPSVGSLLQHEYLRPTTDKTSHSGSQTTNNSTLDTFRPLASLVPIDSSRLAPSPRYKTPVIDIEAPPVPPAMEPIQTIALKNEPPRLGRVVTAGVALQGVLDPSRLTPEPSQKALDEKHDRLNDLFRGFSEGTRRELQAGLRLGEQLAHSQTKEQSSPLLSSPIKALSEAASKGGVYRTHRKYRQSRLLTPEEQDDHIITPTEQITETNHVQYPSLHVAKVENTLLSPGGSEDEMSWRVDTPPIAITGGERRETFGNERGETIRDAQISVVADASRHAQPDDYSDIWQEEASRSSNSHEAEILPVEKSPQLQDLFADEGPIKPARGKLPRTWRRTSANNFQYSDEAESPQQTMRARSVPTEPTFEGLNEGKAKLVEVNLPEEEFREDEEAASDASDDTGMFFQSNLPNVFSKKRPSEFRQKKAEKLDLSLLLNEGGSLVPESSPPVVTKKSSSTTKTNPFLDTPPRFTGFLSSPKKSSPLRQEIRGPDISPDNPQRIIDESSLPLAQSSPFHTYVDGESAISAASDQRQFRFEMEGSTASTIRRVRKEANEYLEAYEPQERSLNEIEEVTEHSRTWHKDMSNLASSPPQRKQNFAQSMLSPSRRSVPPFGAEPRPNQRELAPTQQEMQHEEMDESSVDEETEASSHPVSQPHDSNPAVEGLQQPSTTLFGFITSSLSGAFSRPAPLPSKPHPILSRLMPLPKVEPWTKTHYKALDKLYITHLKHPVLFSPSNVPATPLSRTNNNLLKQFLSTNKRPYVGATFSAWGYDLVLTEALVVLCAVYMELLSLEDITQYEKLTGREIQMGDCAPGRSGDVIKGEEVVRRLATVVLGDVVRRDEHAGKRIDRKQTLTVEWPQ